MEGKNREFTSHTNYSTALYSYFHITLLAFPLLVGCRNVSSLITVMYYLVKSIVTFFLHFALACRVILSSCSRKSIENNTPRQHIVLLTFESSIHFLMRIRLLLKHVSFMRIRKQWILSSLL